MPTIDEKSHGSWLSRLGQALEAMDASPAEVLAAELTRLTDRVERLERELPSRTQDGSRQV